MIYFVRHGFSLNNYRYLTGNSVPLKLRVDEYCPLEKKYGVAQVCETANYLKEKLASRRVLYIVSPYYRTRETLYYILSFQKKGNINIIIDKNLREINHGLQCGVSRKMDFLNDSPGKILSFFDLPLSEQEALYQKSLQSSYASKNHNSEYIEYKNGESIVDVKRRVRSFLKSLKKIQDSNIYDDIVIVTHNTVINVLFSMMTNKISPRMCNGSCLSLNDSNNYQVFNPTVSVPRKFYVNFTGYKKYLILFEMQSIIDVKKDKINFFTGDRKLLMPIEKMCKFISNVGDTWVVLPNDNKKEDLIYISADFGQDNIIYNRDCVSKYYVLSGSGVFYLKSMEDTSFNMVEVNEVNNYIEIPSNTIFYYESCESLRMFLKVQPGFRQDNIVVVGETPNLLKFREDKSNGHIKK